MKPLGKDCNGNYFYEDDKLVATQQVTKAGHENFVFFEPGDIVVVKTKCRNIGIENSTILYPGFVNFNKKAHPNGWAWENYAAWTFGSNDAENVFYSVMGGKEKVYTILPSGEWGYLEL